MKLLVVTEDHLLDHVGGTRVYAHDLNRMLVERGHQVVHLCHQAKETQESVVDGVRVKRVMALAGKPRWHDYLARLWRVRRLIRQNIAQLEPDWVVVHNASMVQFLLFPWLLLPRKKLLYIVHAMVSHEIMFDAGKRYRSHTGSAVGRTLRYVTALGKAAVVWLFEALMLRLCHRIMTVSRYDLSEINRFHGTGHDHKITIVPIGIDLSHYPADYQASTLREKHDLPNDRTLFIIVRRLAPRMGIENLLMALSLLPRDDFLLLVCGKGELSARLEQIIVEQGLSERVRLLGFVTEQQKIELLCASDFFILPTEELEGFGIVILEALAANTPVIGTPVGAIPDILGAIDPELLTGNTSPQAIAERLAWAIDNRARLTDTRRYREIAERHYDWRSVVRQVERLIDKV